MIMTLFIEFSLSNVKQYLTENLLNFFSPRVSRANARLMRRQCAKGLVHCAITKALRCQYFKPKL